MDKEREEAINIYKRKLLEKKQLQANVDGCNYLHKKKMKRATNRFHLFIFCFRYNIFIFLNSEAEAPRNKEGIRQV